MRVCERRGKWEVGNYCYVSSVRGFVSLEGMIEGMKVCGK